MRKPAPPGAKKDARAGGPDRVNADRRQALKTLGQFAVYVSPAMTVLLRGGPAAAHHNPGHGGGSGQCNKKPWLSFC